MFTKKFIMNIEKTKCGKTVDKYPGKTADKYPGKTADKYPGKTVDKYPGKTNHYESTMCNKDSMGDFFYPTEKDALFWILYIAERGVFQYEMDIKKEFIKEQENKIKLIGLIRENKNKIKENKWKLSKLEDELNSNTPISVSTFCCLCLLKDIDLIIKNNNVVYSQINTEREPNNIKDIIIVKFDKSFKKYGLYDYGSSNNTKVEDFLRDNYVITNINKPVNPIGSYKIADLHEICKKLNITICDDGGKKLKKKELYDKVKFYLYI